jgi:hypothetical protein
MITDDELIERAPLNHFQISLLRLHQTVVPEVHIWYCNMQLMGLQNFVNVTPKYRFSFIKCYGKHTLV